MGDDTTRAIDRFFDAVDGGVDKVAHVLGRTEHTQEQIREKHGKRRVVIDAEHSTKPKSGPAPSSAAPSRAAPSVSTAVVVKRPRFYIVEAIDPKSGGTIFVVTDGGAARTECATREFAAQILKALEKTP